MENKTKFPGSDLIKKPWMDLYYEIDILAKPADIWPWIKQVGYHRGGWYVDKWWDRFEQTYFWPYVVPKEARGVYKPPADEILPEFQDVKKGDTIPDGPPGTAYYEVVKIEENSLFLLYATSHFKYVAPQFVYKTRFAPRGSFCWAFMINENENNSSELISWWQAEAYPRAIANLYKPLLILVDRVHQREILKGVKRRVERSKF
jgi:hypothetical protein